MDEFQINSNIFGKYSDFDSWQKAELLSPVKKRKKEREAAKREKWNGTKLWMTETLMKNHAAFQPLSAHCFGFMALSQVEK